MCLPSTSDCSSCLSLQVETVFHPKAENASYSFSPASDARFQTMRYEGKLPGMETPFLVFGPCVTMGRGVGSRGGRRAEV